MKKTFLSLWITLFMVSGLAAQQGGRDLPSVTLKALDGSTLSSTDFENEDGPIIVSFWATWCKPCILELMTIHEEYIDLQDETGVKLIAISIDDARNSPKVAPFVAGKGWEYEVYIDENADFKGAMGVNNVPHTFVLNADRQILWEHNSYSPGDEEDLYEVVEAVAEGTFDPSESHSGPDSHE